MSGDAKMMLRLAFRVEGDWWNAYVAEPMTMDRAVLLGSIRLSAVKGKQKRREAFMALMKSCLRDYLKSAGVWGEISHYEERPAPEHERAGRA